jgi:hypothetical protein
MNACKQEYCDFVGSLAFEEDGGWSYEVWQAAQQAAFKRLAERFRSYEKNDYTGKDVALYIEFLARSNTTSQDVP